MADNWHKITDEVESDICNMYLSGSTLSSIREKLHICDRRIREVIVKNGIEIRNPRKSSKGDDEFDYQREVMKKYPSHEGMHYIARSKDRKAEFDDYLNKSGTLTRYIRSEYGVNAMSERKRVTFFKNTGKLWYEEYFDIIEVPDKEKKYKKCPYCDWKCYGEKNTSGSFVSHLKYEHDMSREEYLKEHPEDKDFLSYASGTLQLQYETDSSKFVICPICGKKLTRLVGKHLQKHGIGYIDFVTTYTGSTICNELHDKLSKSAVETNKTMKFHNRSKGELEIEQWLIDQGIRVNGKRKMVEGKEIDIYLPDHRIGIEFDGILYHTEEYGKDKWYHVDKTETCRRNGIRLIHIFEDEYVYHKELVLSKIGHLVGCWKNKEKIPARKCKICEIGKIEASSFLKKNHIQGEGKSSINLGAFYGDKLISVMSFRNDSNGNWELVRFASDIDKICQGVGGKLFKYFVRNYKPNEVKSFADRRWTVDYNNNVYVKLGFTLEKILPPDYEYVGKGAESHYRQHKFGFRKDRMMKMDKEGVLTYDMTEDEMRKKLGYRRIWNCGLLKYVWRDKEVVAIKNRQEYR